jgi:hypothetical protein
MVQGISRGEWTGSQLKALVFSALDELNEQRPPHERFAKALDTPLAGESATFDSLAFVNFVVLVERQLEQHLGIEVSLLGDERLDLSAFQTVGDLIDQLASLLATRHDD